MCPQKVATAVGSVASRAAQLVLGKTPDAALVKRAVDNTMNGAVSALMPPGVVIVTNTIAGNPAVYWVDLLRPYSGGTFKSSQCAEFQHAGKGPASLGIGMGYPEVGISYQPGPYNNSYSPPFRTHDISRTAVTIYAADCATVVAAPCRILVSGT